MMIANMVPSWVMPGAKFDFDFANKRYWGGHVHEGPSIGATKPPQSMIDGGSGGINVYAPDIYGIVQDIPAYTPRITFGRGLWAEQDNTNIALYCRDLTNSVWTKTNITATKNQAGADLAANAATSLTASAANGTCLQSVTQASAASVFSAYIKRLSGSGVINMTTDNGSTWTNVTSQIPASGYGLVSIPSETVTNPVFGFQIATSGDSIAVDFCQNEQGTYPTTPLYTTSASQARNSDEPTFNTTASAYNDGQRIQHDIFTNGSPWSFFGIYSGNPEVGAGWFISSDGPPVISGGCNGGAFTFMGATTSNNGTQGLGNLNKVTGRVNGYGATCVINGGALATYNTASSGKPYAPGTAITHCGLGNNGSGTSPGPLNGYIARMAFWNREITDGQMIEWTH